MLVLFLNMPESWAWLTPYDVWAADSICTGLMVALAPFWARHGAAAAAAVTFGIARAGCTAIWPTASDPGGSICDTQAGFPFTVGILTVALLALERMRHREKYPDE